MGRAPFFVGSLDWDLPRKHLLLSRKIEGAPAGRMMVDAASHTVHAPAVTEAEEPALRTYLTAAQQFQEVRSLPP